MAATSIEDELDEEKRGNTPVIRRFLMRSKVEEFINKISEERFCEIFSCLSDDGKSWRKSSKIFTVFKDVVRNTAMTELDEMSGTAKLDENLKVLDDLRCIYSDQKGVSQWRPNGNVDESVVSHEMEEKLRRRARLEAVCNDKMSNVKKLKAELDQNISLLKAENELDEELKEVLDAYTRENKIFQSLRQMLREENEFDRLSTTLD